MPVQKPNHKTAFGKYFSCPDRGHQCPKLPQGAAGCAYLSAPASLRPQIQSDCLAAKFAQLEAEEIDVPPAARRMEKGPGNATTL